MLGQALTYFIYIRNLQLQGQWVKTPQFLRVFLLIFPILIVIYGYNNGDYDIEKLFQNADIPLWLLILGSVAQVILRCALSISGFILKGKKSSLPLGFWMLSLAGGALILTYAVLRRDPVLLIGHLIGVFIYIRNIKLSFAIDKGL